MKTLVKKRVKSKQVTGKADAFYAELEKVSQEFVDEGLKIELVPAICMDFNLLSFFVIGYEEKIFDTERNTYD